MILSIRLTWAGDFQTHSAHQRESVAPRDWPILHSIVKRKGIFFEPALKMHVRGARRQLVGDRGQRQVMGRNQSDRSPIEQAPKHTRGAQPPVVRIGAVEELVEKEKQWYGTSRSARRKSEGASPAAS